ncbi:MAG TPA: flagellar protein FliS [Clostridiales bacterium]|nr:flagellar protein FliS [Clostridiales bacterium]
MRNDLIQAFAKRTTQASKTELVVIQYEIILQCLNDAEDSISNQDIEEFTKSLNFANKFLKELIGTLDYKYIISYELLHLYLYASKCLVLSIIKEDSTFLKDAANIIEKLLFAFNEISKEDDSGPVMQNTQKVYAGLTYGKNNVNETFINLDNNRGFKA